MVKTGNAYLNFVFLKLNTCRILSLILKSTSLMHNAPEITGSIAYSVVELVAH